MKGVVRRRAAARRDLIEIFQRYAREASLGVARHFRAEAEAGLARLAVMPGLGTFYETDNPALGELRFFPVGSPFKSCLIFYRPLPGGIEVARILHGTRDIQTILGDDLGVDQGDPGMPDLT